MKELGGWWPWLQKFSVFWKYYWPVGKPWLQTSAIFTILLAFVNKMLTILFSYYLGLLVTQLSEAVKRSELRSAEVFPLFLGLAITYASTTAAISNLRSYLFMKVKVSRTRELYLAIHKKIISLDFYFHNTINPSDILRITNDSKGLLEALDNICIVLVPNVVMLVSSVTFLIRKHRAFIALDLLVLLVGYFVAQRRTAKKLPKELDNYFATHRDMDACCRENILCWETIASHSKTTTAIEQYTSKVDAWVKQWDKYLIYLYVGEFLTGIVIFFSFTFGLLLILHDIFNERATPGDLVAFVGYWQSIITSLNTFKNANTDILGKLLEATRGRRVLEMPLQVEDRPEFKFRGGKIRFEGVEFSYEGNKDPALRGLNLEILAGEKVSIVGASGSGKSTMVKVLQGHVNPSVGIVQVDDQRIGDIDISSYRSHFGIITQNTHFFDETIKYNMLYFARLDVTEEQIQDACRKACIHDTIMSFPNGYATKIGDNGQKLSGGERQRLAIARLILQDPDIVVLDESTSALDVDNEILVQKAIHEEFTDKTVIIIEHGLSSTESADKIVVLGKGCVVLEQGTHKSLLQKDGCYAELWKQYIRDHSDEREQ
ncbi:P-loop containing nucleoside triphosphate hydrolase protein [Colletotrichum somersetense]|nr:P-loop containing nucleoside triphosphate hydrolase protein [Colletotrichum somersetense]